MTRSRRSQRRDELDDRVRKTIFAPSSQALALSRLLHVSAVGMLLLVSGSCGGEKTNGQTHADQTDSADASADGSEASADGGKSHVDTSKLGPPCTVSGPACACVSFVRIDPAMTQPRCVSPNGNNECDAVVCAAGKNCINTEETDPEKVECW